MTNFFQNPASDGDINDTVLRVSAATPLYLFMACVGSFLILLVIQIVHDIEFWTATMPTIGPFVAIAGALFVQVVRFGGLLGSTFNFSRGKAFAGFLCLALSVSVSLWEHSHVPGMAAYFITSANEFMAKEQFTTFLRILIWIGLGLEVLIVASTAGTGETDVPGKRQGPRYQEEAFDFQMNGGGPKR